MAVIQSLPCNKVKKKEIEERKVKKEIVEEWNQSRCIGGRPRGCHSAWATWQLHFLSFCSIKGKGDGIRRWEESLNKFGIGRNESLFIRKIRSCRLTPPLPDASVYHNLHPIRCLSSCVLGGRTRKKGQTHTHTSQWKTWKRKKDYLISSSDLATNQKTFFRLGVPNAMTWRTVHPCGRLLGRGCGIRSVYSPMAISSGASFSIRAPCEEQQRVRPIKSSEIPSPIMLQTLSYNTSGSEWLLSLNQAIDESS